jgi:hypothetical protein
MKTITLFTIAMDVCALPAGFKNPKAQRALIELNEHVKRKQNE